MMKREWRGMTLQLVNGRIVTTNTGRDGQRVNLSLPDAAIVWFECPCQNDIVCKARYADGESGYVLFRAGPAGVVGLNLIPVKRVAGGRLVADALPPEIGPGGGWPATAAADERGDAADLELPPELGGEGGG